MKNEQSSFKFFKLVTDCNFRRNKSYCKTCCTFTVKFRLDRYYQGIVISANEDCATKSRTGLVLKIIFSFEIKLFRLGQVRSINSSNKIFYSKFSKQPSLFQVWNMYRRKHGFSTMVVCAIINPLSLISHIIQQSNNLQLSILISIGMFKIFQSFPLY